MTSVGFCTDRLRTPAVCVEFASLYPCGFLSGTANSQSHAIYVGFFLGVIFSDRLGSRASWESPGLQWPWSGYRKWSQMTLDQTTRILNLMVRSNFPVNHKKNNSCLSVIWHCQSMIPIQMFWLLSLWFLCVNELSIIIWKNVTLASCNSFSWFYDIEW